MRFIINEISIAGIYKNGFKIMLLYIARIRFLYIEQVFIGDRLLVFALPFLYVRLQLRYRCMQVNQYIRMNELLVNNIEQLLVKPELLGM